MKFLADFLLLIPLALVAIGDGVRFLIWALFKIFLSFFKRLGRIKPARPLLRLPKLPKFPKLPKLSRLLKLPKLPRLEIDIEFKRPRKLPKIGRIFPTPFAFGEKLRWILTGITLSSVFLFIPYSSWIWLKELPNPKLLTQRDLSVTTKIFDRSGSLLYEIYAGENRTPVPLKEIPLYVRQATIAIEDADFYRHKGFSLKGIARSIKELVFNRRIQGGSTITQQLVKSALLTPEIKLSRKIKEIILAFWAERIYSKDQILEMYFNQVPYGGTAWGIEAAAQMYFGKSVRFLTLAQAALLAGLPAAPTAYSPYGSDPQKAFARQAEVLRRMVEERFITQKEAQLALSEEVHISPAKVSLRAPHFVMYVKDLLEKRYGPRLVEKGGLRITTSLDINTQEQVENTVKTHVDSLTSLHVGNGAALVTNPKTGEIVAMVGSRDYFDTSLQGNVNVTTSLQQPGSAIKAVTYAAALTNGFTPATVLDDSPVIFRSSGSPDYLPVNYNGKFHGPVPLRYALGNSYNIPAVKTLNKIGLATMLETGRRMGITTWQDESRFGLSLTLGGGEVTMLDMAKVYGTLANLGKRADPNPILEVSDYTGKVYERNRPKGGVSAVKPEVAWILTDILSDNKARSNAFGPNSSLVIPGKTVAVKTGTSNDKRDNWTIGFTPSYVVVVWVGNNDNSPMNPILTSGVTGAAPIWHDIMVELLKDKTEEKLPKPGNIVEIPCYFGRVEYFIKGTEPATGRCAPLPTPTPTPSVTPTP